MKPSIARTLVQLTRELVRCSMSRVHSSSNAVMPLFEMLGFKFLLNPIRKIFFCRRFQIPCFQTSESHLPCPSQISPILQKHSMAYTLDRFLPSLRNTWVRLMKKNYNSRSIHPRKDAVISLSGSNSVWL